MRNWTPDLMGANHVPDHPTYPYKLFHLFKFPWKMEIRREQKDHQEILNSSFSLHPNILPHLSRATKDQYCKLPSYACVFVLFFVCAWERTPKTELWILYEMSLSFHMILSSSLSLLRNILPFFSHNNSNSFSYHARCILYIKLVPF